MLNYEISGNGKETLVMLHGFMENLLIWEDMEVHLSNKFRLVKIDLPGHGPISSARGDHPRRRRPPRPASCAAAAVCYAEPVADSHASRPRLPTRA